MSPFLSFYWQTQLVFLLPVITYVIPVLSVTGAWSRIFPSASALSLTQSQREGCWG
jgi:hypothetical protein